MPKNTNTPVQLSELQIEGYNCFTNVAEVSCRRGTCIYIKNSIPATPLELPSHFSDTEETSWCEVNLEKSDRMIIGCIYRSPNSSSENGNQLNRLIKYMSDKNPSHLLIMGDFNYPEIDWHTQTSSKHEPHDSVTFLDGMQDAFLFQHVSSPTHYRAEQNPTLIDLIFSKDESDILEVTHRAPIGKSHHAVLSFQYVCYASAPHPVRSIQNYNKADYDKIRLHLRNINWKQALRSKNAQEMWQFIEGEIKTLTNKWVPQRNINSRKRQKPLWLTNKLVAKTKAKNSAFKKYRSSRSSEDYVKYAKARNQVKWECRKAVRDFEKKIAQESKTNPKAFYKYAGSKLKTRSGVADLLKPDGTTATTNKDKANTLNSFFTSVFTNENTSNLPIFQDRAFGTPLTKFEITTEIVEKKLHMLNPNKSPGPDNIHPRLLKETAPELALPLQMLFMRILKEGRLPQCWKNAHVTPIYKKDKKSEPGNYRPVSLLSIISKQFESILKDRIMEHMSKNNLFTTKQHGFVKGRSCITNLIELMEDWTRILDDDGKIDSIYLDFRKAFDSVPHQRLLSKLFAYGIRGNLLECIKDFLTNRKQRVMVNGSPSEWETVLSGVPQGSVLGPILFVVYVNDMPECVHQAISMFADDTKLYAKIDSDSDQECLQQDLAALEDWSDKWQIKFNPTKCKVMHLGNDNPQYIYNMRSGTTVTPLQKTTCEKDLGVFVDNNLSFDHHINQAVNKSNRLLGLIRRTYTYLDKDSLKTLFTALVRPHLEYGNTVWHPHLVRNIESIEKVQRRATKLVPELHDKDYEVRLKLLDLPSMEYRRLRGDLIETYKYLTCIYLVEGCPLQRIEGQQISTRGHSLKLNKPRSRKNTRLHFFSNRIVNAWNHLPEDVVSASTLHSFKARLDKFLVMHRYSTKIKVPA